MPTLRPYQLAAVEAVRGHVRAGKRKVLVVAPTGSGKTVIAAHIIASAAGKGKRALFVAHRRELIEQTVRKLADAGVPANAIGVMMSDDRRTRESAPIQIASIDTLRNRDLPPAELVIIDEAHRSLAASYLAAIEHYAASGATILGLTATPYRADGSGMGATFQVLEIVASPSELIAAGYIVEPRVFSAQGPDLSGVRVRAGEYHESDLADAVSGAALVGDIVDHWKRHAAGVRTVAFAVNVAHSRSIVARFVEAGIAAEHLDGATPTLERDAILARLERGETLIVGNCGVLFEGWDMPSVKAAILARPTKSAGLYLQQAGRILRPFDGQRAVILDHAGNALAHGLPQADREFSLDATKKQIGNQPARICPECETACALSARECPECGHVFAPAKAADPIKERGGELVEVIAPDDAEMRRYWAKLVAEWEQKNAWHAARGERPSKPGSIFFRFQDRYGRKPPAGCKLPIEIASEEEKARALATLRTEANAKGYKLGWAVHRYSERFGHAPPKRTSKRVA